MNYRLPDLWRGGGGQSGGEGRGGGGGGGGGLPPGLVAPALVTHLGKWAWLVVLSCYITVQVKPTLSSEICISNPYFHTVTTMDFEKRRKQN